MSPSLEDTEGDKGTREGGRQPQRRLRGIIISSARAQIPLDARVVQSETPNHPAEARTEEQSAV